MTATAVEENALATREETNTDLQTTQAAAMARYEMEGALVVARRFPRNEDTAFQKLMKSCGRPTFAADTAYSFPRGGEQVTGPSVYLAKEAARVWGNIRYGVDIIADDNENRHIRGWAWDVETNSRTSADDFFAKLVYRKKGGWIKPDERDLRELTNRRAAILVRNCILSLLPTDLIEDALEKAKQTMQSGVSNDLEGSRKKLLSAFGSLGISAEEIEAYVGHKIAQLTAPEITNLRQVWKSISDGNSKWADYLATANDQRPETKGPVSADDLLKPKKAGAADQSETSQEAEKSSQPAADKEPDNDYLAGLADELDACETVEQVGAVEGKFKRPELTLGQIQFLQDACAKRRKSIEKEAKKK